jgi:L-ascorbate metabolism protein UlaG (beta-lactamase superfamily)
MKQSQFGKAPAGPHLERIQKSPNYQNGKFQNLSPTPALTEGYSIPGIIYSQFFKKHPRRKPIGTIPSVKTDLLRLRPEENILVWFGHSSYFMQVDGKKILVDPVFSGSASPIPGGLKSFDGTDIYSVADLPEIDYLFISHDHYDHLDFQTIRELKHKVNTVICGLGVSAHFEHWGYGPAQLIEKDWNDVIDLGAGFTVFVTPARHFSGRGLSRNNTLWCSYVLQTPALKIYIGGDSGYDAHFAEIGNQFGPIDLVILENGQYNAAWKYIHQLPGQVLQAAQDLKAKRLFPVHSAKFALSDHPWDEPLKRITELNEQAQVPLVTPMIGEVVYLEETTQAFRQWWGDVE